MRNRISSQSGVVLIVTLLVLLLIAILATTVSQTNLLQVQMSSNEESKMESMQEALAIVDAILNEPDNMAVVGGVGYKLCETGIDPDSAEADGCVQFQLSVDSALVDAAADINYFVERVSPDVPAAFTSLDQVTTAENARVAMQEIVVTIDRTQQNRGFTRVVQGYQREFFLPGNVEISD